MRRPDPQATFTIRAARRDDLAFLRRCAQEAYEIYIEAIGRAPAPMLFDFEAAVGHDTIEVLEADGHRVGHMRWELRRDCLFLDSIAITREAQGHGFARRAFDHLERVARATRRPAIELYTNVAMISNLTLYPHLGFTVSDRRHEDGYDRVYFRKALDPAPSND